MWRGYCLGSAHLPHSLLPFISVPSSQTLDAMRVCLQSLNPLSPYIVVQPVLSGFVLCTQLGRPHMWERLMTGASRVSNMMGFVMARPCRIIAVVFLPSPSPTLCTGSDYVQFGNSSCICWDKICTAVETIKMKTYSSRGGPSQTSTEYLK